MKKLLFVLAVALTASASYATAALWKATGLNYYDGTGSTETSAKYTGYLYIFDTDVLSQSALYDAWCKDSSYVEGHAIATLDVSEGKIVTAENANYFNYGVKEQAGYSFYSVLVDDEQIYFSNIKSDLTASGSDLQPQTIAFLAQNDGSTTYSSLAPTPGSGFEGAGHWSAVPEPFSGSLALLGVGLVALRRRMKKAKGKVEV